MAARVPEVSEQSLGRLGHADNEAGERSESNRAEQSLGRNIESLTLANESDSNIIDKDDLGDSESPVTFRLLPQLVPIRSACDTATPRSRASPHETIPRVSLRYGSSSDLYICCQCFIGPQVWQVNPFCSDCGAIACPRCRGVTH